MAVSAKMTVAAAAASLLWAGAACAQQAQTAAPPPSDRCEGTLCDLYYSTRPAQAAASSGATAQASAATAPSSSGGFMNWFSRGNGPVNAQPIEPPSSSNGYMSLGTGGILGGRTNDRCSGTLCDTYYGVVGKSDGAQPAGEVRTAAAGGVELPVIHRHVVHESETRPKCASAQAGDPWHCFR